MPRVTVTRESDRDHAVLEIVALQRLVAAGIPAMVATAHAPHIARDLNDVLADAVSGVIEEFAFGSTAEESVR